MLTASPSQHLTATAVHNLLSTETTTALQPSTHTIPHNSLLLCILLVNCCTIYFTCNKFMMCIILQVKANCLIHISSISSQQNDTHKVSLIIGQ